MAAPEGNDFSNKDNRLWRNTLRRIAVQNPEKLRAIAEKLYDKAAEGDVQAVKEIGDRLDGKAVQATELSGPDGGPMVLSKVERLVVDPANPNG